MQLNKASKKTRKIADETKAAAPETSAAADVAASPRTTRSSKTKKTETTETGSMKHRHNKGNAAAEAAPVENVRAATAAGSGSIIVDAVGVVAPGVEAPIASAANVAPRRDVTREEIAKLAYSYWIARGHSHGGAQEDWLRAEQELRQR